MSKKLTIEFIRFEFEKECYILLTTEYKNCFQKLEYVCPKGHKHRIAWIKWQQGKRCPYCRGGVRLNIKKIRTEFEKEGCIFLSIKYINQYQKLKYICPNGHRHGISWNNWRAGKRCSFCSNRIKKTIKFIKQEFEKEGYILLTNKYKNAKQKLDYICPNGHERSISWGSWQRGCRCLVCNNIAKTGPGHPNWKGGISCEPYCDVWLNRDFKESIKQRDGCRCMNPDCWGTSKRLSIHHIDYIKKNCDPRNLITLCTSCNSRANKNREWHTAWYQAIMYMRCGVNEI